MAAPNRSDVHRLDKVVSVRQTLSSVAEARVRETEAQVREIELQDAQLLQTIFDSRAEIAQQRGLLAFQFQRNEKYIEALKLRRNDILQALENTKIQLAERVQEWTVARQEQKVIERLQERRLQECRREEEIVQQKSVDEAFLGRLVHTRIHG